MRVYELSREELCTKSSAWERRDGAVIFVVGLGQMRFRNRNGLEVGKVPLIRRRRLMLLSNGKAYSDA